MPELSKVRWSQLKVGIVAFVAMVILAVLIFLLTGNSSIFERDETVRTYMADGAGMTQGRSVLLNGILVGAVQGIKLSGSKDPRRAVEFELTIKEKYMRDIPDDSTAAVTAANLLGSKFIDITKGQSATPVKPGGELRSLQTQDIPELMAQSANLIQTLQDISKRADAMLADIDAGKGNLGKLLRDDELYKQFTELTAKLDATIDRINSGQGTVGQLLVNPQMYDAMNGAMREFQALAKDIRSNPKKFLTIRVRIF